MELDCYWNRCVHVHTCVRVYACVVYVCLCVCVCMLEILGTHLGNLLTSCTYFYRTLRP